jgi:hypothetical protein
VLDRGRYALVRERFSAEMLAGLGALGRIAIRRKWEPWLPFARGPTVGSQETTEGRYDRR